MVERIHEIDGNTPDKQLCAYKNLPKNTLKLVNSGKIQATLFGKYLEFSLHCRSPLFIGISRN